jgi:DNA-binding MarR family transcriptional regulator
MDAERQMFLKQQTFATLFSLANKLQVYGDTQLKKLTSRQLMSLIAVIHLPVGETTLNNIARKLGTTKQNVGQIMACLERKGYVSTVPHRRDKRAVNVKISASGKRVMLACGAKGIEFFNALFRDFTPEEIEILWGSLKKLYRFDGQEQDGFEEEVNFAAQP